MVGVKSPRRLRWPQRKDREEVAERQVHSDRRAETVLLVGEAWRKRVHPFMPPAEPSSSRDTGRPFQEGHRALRCCQMEAAMAVCRPHEGLPARHNQQVCPHGPDKEGRKAELRMSSGRGDKTGQAP